jgi:transposase
LHLDRTDVPAASEYATVCLVFELSKAKWKLEVMLAGLQKMSRFTITGGDVTVLAARSTAIGSKACHGGRPVRILACYAAGLDGHWLQRWLAAQGVICDEVAPASIEVNRRAQRARTDRGGL